MLENVDDHCDAACAENPKRPLQLGIGVVKLASVEVPEDDEDCRRTAEKRQEHDPAEQSVETRSAQGHGRGHTKQECVVGHSGRTSGDSISNFLAECSHFVLSQQAGLMHEQKLPNGTRTAKSVEDTAEFFVSLLNQIIYCEIPLMRCNSGIGAYALDI
jgi:hypothetical protein